MPIPTTRRALLAAACACALAPLAARAQAQPATVKLLLPHAAGSGVDAIARAAQPALAKALAASVVVDNQPGAGGVVGLQALSRAQPDGSTLGMVSNNAVILPGVLKSLPFDMPGDFTPIAVVGATPMVLVVNPAKLPVAGAREFFAQLKAKPGAFNYGSGGNGTILHLAAAMVLDEAGVDARHIPYRGVGQMVGDLLGGQIDFAVLGLNSVQQHLASGALRPVGLLTPQRVPAAPQVPTFAEQGLANFAVDAWFAVVGPKGMAPAAVKRAHDAVAAAFADPGTKEAMAKQGNTIAIGTPEQAQATFRRDVARYAALAKKVGLELQ